MGEVTAFRLFEAAHRAHAMDGEGAKRHGGRWNNPGTAIVYAAESMELARQEVLESPYEMKGELDALRLTFPLAIVRQLDFALLPPGWKEDPAPAALRQIGDDFARRGLAAVLRVPSAMIDGAFNYLLNPTHPDFRLVSQSRTGSR